MQGARPRVELGAEIGKKTEKIEGERKRDGERERERAMERGRLRERGRGMEREGEREWSGTSRDVRVL